MREQLEQVPNYFKEYLPTEFLHDFQLLDVQTTIKNIHYPESEKLKNQAIHRIFFDRLLRIQIFSLMNKRTYQNKQKTISQTQQRDLLKDILSRRLFQLTTEQKK